MKKLCATADASRLFFCVDNQLFRFRIVEAIDRLHRVEHKKSERENRRQHERHDYAHPRAGRKRADAVANSRRKCGRFVVCGDRAERLNLKAAA